MKFGMAMLVAIGALALSGCNTIAGAGSDTTSGGPAIEDAAHKLRHEWRETVNRNERLYETARKACVGTTGPEYDTCHDRARADYRTRMSEARQIYRRSDMRAVTPEDRKEDRYDAAREKCETMRGAKEDHCEAQALAIYPH